MKKVSAGFFSFTEVTDPAEHHSYNEWHQLDHMPEQFPLQGIVYGQRWVWPPSRRFRSAGNAHASPPFDRVHYVTLYLMQEPLDETLTEFLELGKELGRKGRFHRQRHAHLSGPFELVGAHAAARVLISPEAVPYRPHHGVRVTVESVDSVERDFDDEPWRTELAPTICAVDGVAGVWRFATSTRFDNHVWRPGTRRISMVWIDGDLDATTTKLAELEPERAEMAATLETITPWQWDWFERT